MARRNDQHLLQWPAAMVEHDPGECGSVDRADYYDGSGKLIRSETRKPGALSQSK